MRPTRFLVAVIAVVALLAGGCGDDDDSPSESTGQSDSGADTDDPSSDGATDGGGESSGAGGGTSVDTSDIAVPLPPGADAVARSDSGPLSLVQFIVPLDQRESTIAFYDDWTESESDEYQRVEAEAGGVSWQNAVEAGEDHVIIAVLAPLEGDDFVTVTLSVGPLQ